MPTERVDSVVIGAGVAGLAVARALALAGREVIVLEAKSRLTPFSPSDTLPRTIPEEAS